METKKELDVETTTSTPNQNQNQASTGSPSPKQASEKTTPNSSKNELVNSTFSKNKQILWSFFGCGKNFHCVSSSSSSSSQSNKPGPQRCFNFLCDYDHEDELESIISGMKYDHLLPCLKNSHFLIFLIF